MIPSEVVVRPPGFKSIIDKLATGAAQQVKSDSPIVFSTRLNLLHEVREDVPEAPSQRSFALRPGDREKPVETIVKPVDAWLPVPLTNRGGFTGANTERPAFQRLQDDIQAGTIDLVVVYKVDRLSRSLLDFARVMDSFHTHGAEFVSVTQKTERIRDKLRASKRRGKWTGGRVPYGYDILDKRLVECPEEAAIVREVFALYGELGSAMGVARRLNERGLTTARYAVHGFVTRDQPWSKSDILRILPNPVYVGTTRCGGNDHAGEHAPIVTKEAFQQAAATLGTFAARRGAARNPAYLLTGIIHCGTCGGLMTLENRRRLLQALVTAVRYDEQAETLTTELALGGDVAGALVANG